VSVNIAAFLVSNVLASRKTGEYDSVNWMGMNRTDTAPDGWHPQTQQECDAVLRELQTVLASPHFSNSKRYPALLKYIVVNTLAGKSDLLKERTLGVEVFDRPVTYDTNADTVVRYTAGEVRKRLLLFYHEEGRNSSIRISLPAGSYVPVFLREQDRLGDHVVNGGHEAGPFLISDRPGDLVGGTPEFRAISKPGTGVGSLVPAWPPELIGSPSLERRKVVLGRLLWLTLTVMVAIGAGYFWTHRSIHPESAVDDFWAPLTRDQRSVIICTGSVVFAQDKYSGVITAGSNGNVDYPFVSIQSASAIAQIDEAIERSGASTQLIASPWTTLTDLREHSIALIGAYNNQWTIRLLEPLRFHFLPDPQARIVDALNPKIGWERDESVPYSSADDYAVVARFRDPNIDGWVVALAGLGRNGTEAAAQFASSPHYLELLERQLGGKFGNRNIEVVLKVGVINAKTGAPSIIAVHTW
jgi:hypothetical protein